MFDGKEITKNGIKYWVDFSSKTAKVLSDYYYGSVVIPQTVYYNGTNYVVNELGNQCFKYCSSLKSVTLPDGIVSLGNECFYGCEALTSITLPKSVVSVGAYCFSRCKSLTSITLPEGITSLRKSCFEDCSGLTSITLPAKITSLGDRCFSECRKLAEVTLPNSVTSLGNGCFELCTSLTSITLPEGITSLSESCFHSCTGLTSITLSAGITSLGNGCFSGCISLPSITLPDGVTYLGKECFSSCTVLTSITLPARITSLRDGCFYHCGSLTSITLPDGVTSLGKECFSGCEGLTSITFPAGVTSLGDGCFYYCKSLTNVTLPPGITSLGNKCFAACSSLTSIILPDVITSLGDRCFSSCSSLASITLPTGITSLGNGCFYYCSRLDNVVLPKSVTSLGEKCFSDCSSLTSITLPGSVSLLSDSCFSGCNDLTNVVLLKGVTSLGKKCFSDCRSLTSIALPSTLKLIGDGVLSGVTNSIVIYSSAQEPPTNMSDDFVSSTVRLNVPEESLEKYTSISPWSKAYSINPFYMVESIKVPTDATFKRTETVKLDYTVLPDNAGIDALRWKSNAPDIARVNENTGIITAYRSGDVVITVSAIDGSGVSASTTIHMMPIEVDSLGVTNEITLLRSLSQQIETTITPKYADNKTLKWTSDNENIATVTQKGVVKGVNVGTANITATTTDGSNLSATCKVTVTPVTIDLSTNTINLRKGDSYAEQVVNVLPENYEHKDVSWSSSDNSVASVNASGIITAVKPGITTIKYVLDYDNNISSECKVIVYEDNVVYVGGIYYILDKKAMVATVTSIYGGKNTSLEAKNVAQYYSGTINIPETVIYDGDKYTVKYVGNYAFNCQNELQSIIVPRTVTAIRANAAIKAENLNRVNVANESLLDSIGKQAFMECTGLKRFTFDGTSLFMNIIDKEAFKNCTALERVTWTDDTSIKTIGNSSFYGCSALEKVQWLKKSELQTIQDYAFFRCTSLNNFDMPNTTLSVGNSSFRYNSSLTNIHLSTSLNYIDEYAFGECGFSQITLPESLANIQAGAFINNEHLQEITLPERLQGLGSAAFENNSALASVTFKTAIETMTIGSNAFNQCPILNKVYITNLNSFAQTNFNNAKANPANTSQHIYDANGREIINVVLPKGTKYVNNNAFNGCAYIESIEMPATMDHVNDDIFYGCSALKDVYCYAEDVPDFIGVNDPSSMAAVFKQATLHVPFGSEAKYQKDTEWWGRFGSIQGCDPQPTQVVSKIDLSTRTVNLKKGTTYDEQKITISPAEAANVRIKYSTANRNVADIDENGVIHGVAAGVTTITYTANDGSGVTADCKVIVREPEVEYVGDLYYLFDKSKKEATVTSIYGGKNTSLDAEKVAQYYTGTVNIPEQTTFDAVTYDVKAIGGYAFTCQNDLQALRVGAFVEEIADNAATKAMNLNRITVANASHLKNIGKEAFMDCTSLQHVFFEGTTNSMETINEAAFKNCTALQDVIWEGQSTLKVIGNSAFYACSKLETVKWNDLCSLQTIEDYAFYKCSSLNNFLMPNSTLSVGKYAFRYDEALTDIQLSTSLSIIYDYAFGECGFTQIVLPESLKSLQAGAFINNSYLADITIPKKLEGIGAGAFENNDALETVTFKTHETKLTVDKNAFNYCPVLSRVNIDYLDDWAHINFQNAEANPASTAHRLYLNNEEVIDVNLPVGTKYLGNNVFNACSNIRTLVVPATVEHINDNVIYGCTALRDVYCYAAKVPQFIGTDDPSAMSDVFSQATLHVIYGNEAAYKADTWWGRFYKVEGCDAPSDEDVKVTSITISQTAATLKPNDTMQLEATVYPTNAANKKVNWKSSNEDVVIVTDEGFVLAIAEGEADITAEAADGSVIQATCHVTVENEKKPEVPIVEIKFEVSPVTITIGKSYKLNVIFNPANATNKQLIWKSAMPSVVSVDDEGTIVGLSEGKSIVSAKTADGSNLTINCVVTVTKATGIDDNSTENVKITITNHHLKVTGLVHNDIIHVANAAGFTVYRGTEHEIDLAGSGIYIITVNGRTQKVYVK